MPAKYQNNSFVPVDQQQRKTEFKRFDLVIDTEEGAAATREPDDDAVPVLDSAKPFTPVDKLAQSKLDQKFQNSIDVNVEDMFGNSIDQPVEGEQDEDDDSSTDNGGKRSQKSENINELVIDTINIGSKPDKAQLELEREFENQMMEAGIGLKDATQGEDELA